MNKSSPSTSLSTATVLKTENMTIRFGGLVAVKNLCLEIKAGELIGLIGPNGAGKTTCFNMITGIYVPTEGDIVFDGHSVVGVPPHKICLKGMCRTFQNIRLFGQMTVLENIMVSLHPERKYNLLSSLFRTPGFRAREKVLQREALDILHRMAIGHTAHKLAKNLPYGEQRKVEIARALAAKPKLLLLDEPAAGMNPAETAQLSDLIKKIRDDFKIAILLIEHDMSLVMKICERIYVLDYGELIAQGGPVEVRNNPRVIEAYLGGGLEANHD